MTEKFYRVTKYNDKQNKLDRETLKRFNEEICEWFNNTYPNLESFDIKLVFARGILDLQTSKSIKRLVKYNRVKCKSTVQRDTWSQPVKFQRFLDTYVSSWKSRITETMKVPT